MSEIEQDYWKIGLIDFNENKMGVMHFNDIFSTCNSVKCGVDEGLTSWICTVNSKHCVYVKRD